MAEHAIEVVVAMDHEDALAGRLFSHRRGGRESASFAYDASYLAREDAYALDPAMPLVQGALQTSVGLHMFRAFADTAPDRWGRALITRAEKRRATAEGGTARTLGEIEFLLGVRDDLRQGALRFRDPATGVFLASGDAGVPQLTGLANLLQAADHLDADEETEVELRDLLRAGSSLGGARPKAHVIDSLGRVAIAKFPSARYDAWNVPAWEGVSLDLARRAGIRVPDSQLLRIFDRSVLVVNRFDREEDRRIGYVSAMTMLEASPGDVGSYLDIAAAIEQVSARATDDLHELWRRIAFGILTSNTDDHLRNHGFLHVRASAWNLSPAFDLNPDPAPGPKYLSMTIDGYERAASVQTLLSAAPFFRLDENDAIEVLGEVVDTTLGWRDAAAAAEISQAEIDDMAWAFVHTQTHVARDLAGA